jgi:hypothetical protein
MVRRAPPPVPRLADVPNNIEDKVVAGHLRQLRETLVRELSARPPFTQPQPDLLLMSPNGTVYRLTVNDAGFLATTALTS